MLYIGGMVEHTAAHVTQLLSQAAAGQAGVMQELLPLLYDELRKAAQVHMRQERGDHTLTATALVHEAYLRLLGDADVNWQNRWHFHAAAGQAMRRILVEHARARSRLKRGGDAGGSPARRVPLNMLDLATDTEPEEILALDAALCRLEEKEPNMAEVVRLRFFAGLSGDETAQALGVSPRQVDRWWSYARAKLFQDVERILGNR